MTKLNINKRRNLLHNHPLLKKGGVHQRTNKAKRRKDKTDHKKEWPMICDSI